MGENMRILSCLAGLIVLALLGLAAPVLSADTDTETKAETEARQAGYVTDYLRIIARPGEGRAAMTVLTKRSVLNALDPKAPGGVDADRLAAVSYDPMGLGVFNAGELYFYLGNPIWLKKSMGDAGDWYEGELLAARLVWLSGDVKLAEQKILELVRQRTEWGWEDKHFASALADAWLLADRAGRKDEAQGYLDRALAAKDGSSDLMEQNFASLGDTSKASISDIGTVEEFRSFAVKQSEYVFGATRQKVIEQANFEAKLANPETASKFIDAAIDRITKGLLSGGADDPSEQDRVDVRHVLRRLPMWRRLGYMIRDLVAPDTLAVYQRDAAGTITFDTAALATVSYSNEPVPGFIGRRLAYQLPILSVIGTQNERFAARILLARLAWSQGRTKRALDLITGILADAATAGIADVRLGSVLTDAWALAQGLGDDRAAAFLERAKTCVVAANCRGDLAQTKFDTYRSVDLRAGVDSFNLGHMAQIGEAYSQLYGVNKADLLAALHGSAAVDAEDIRPIDAAREAQLALAYMAKSFTQTQNAQSMASDAADNLGILMRAGLYFPAAQWAQKFETTLGRENLDEKFLWVWARILFHLNDPKAEEIYQLAADIFVLHGTSRGNYPTLLLDLMDTPYLYIIDQVVTARPDAIYALARLRYRQGRAAQSAAILHQSRLDHVKSIAVDVLGPVFSAVLDRHRAMGGVDGIAKAQANLDGLAEGRVPNPEHPALMQYYFVAGKAVQEAFYLEAAGQKQAAADLRAHIPAVEWVKPPKQPFVSGKGVRVGIFETESYSNISDIVDFRDYGNYEGAAYIMRYYASNVAYAESVGSYTDAQTLWQMAFTFARGTQQDIAFDLMSRAAKIASNLSFENATGPDGGSLQLLERDRWRYLLFIDIAWAAVTGKTPEEMLVVSRY